MKRRLVLLVSAVALVAVAASCGSDGSSSAATVNGVPITDKQLLDELDAIGSNSAYVKLIEDSSNGQVKVLGESSGSYNAGFVASVLNRRVQFALIHQEIQRRKLEIGADCLAAAKTKLQSAMGQGDASAGEALLKAFPADYRTQQEQYNADVLQLEAELSGQGCATPDGAAQQAYYDAHKADFRQVCLAHILVATEAEADQLYAQLQAGANFADLAKQKSTDSTAPQGGDLGCATKGSFAPEFENAAFAATPGVATKPVQTQFGWHLILVDHFVDETFEQAQNLVEHAMQSAAADALAEWLSKATGDAKVTVSSRYGTWDDSTNSVVAPSSSSESTTTTAIVTPGP